MTKKVTKLKDNRVVDSSLIINDNKRLNKVLDRLNNSLYIYDKFYEKNAKNVVIKGNTTQFTTTGKNLINAEKFYNFVSKDYMIGKILIHLIIFMLT